MSRIKLVLSALSLVLCSLAFAEGPTNINTADAQALAEAIKGVGIKKAEAIVAYRAEHGPFESVDDLAKVQGIGAKTVDESRDSITVKP